MHSNYNGITLLSLPCKSLLQGAAQEALIEWRIQEDQGGFGPGCRMDDQFFSLSNC